MPLAYPRFRYFVLVFAILITWLATASTSLFAAERVATLWISDQPSQQLSRQAAHQTDLPAPVESVTPPREITDKPSAQHAIASDRQEPPQCFIAAPMSSLTVNVALPTGLLPKNVAAHCAATTVPTGDSRLQSNWTPTSQHWAATCQMHQPLYFEEVGAERYGHTSADCLQPLISAGRFFLTIPALPYKMAVDCPRDCTYTLGHYRPGSCAPWRLHHTVCQGNASLVQTGFLVGLILLLP